MTLVDYLRQWDQAVKAVGKDVSEALSILQSIQESNSKIFFNVGCLQLFNHDFDAAEKAFDRSIAKDEHLAIAFFQRGIALYRKERFEECVGDFQYALKLLRGNPFIDYKNLGLAYQLYAVEVLHNLALGQAQLGRWDLAQEHLLSALRYKTEAKINLLDRALEATLKQKLFKLAEVPSKLLFKPNQKFVAELEKKDYLGKAKVLSAVRPEDADYSGFAPLQPQVERSPVETKPPEVLRALEGEPHLVLYEFIPKTSDELALKPGNMVFMLNKGTDNWATVLFNERRGIVPYNFLQPISLKQYQDGKNSGAGTPQSPREREEPPVTPPEKKGPTAAPPHTPNLTSEQDSMEESPLCTVKVYFTYNIAVSLSTGSPYTTLVEKISGKLNMPADSITLSLSSSDDGQMEIDPNTEMDKVWSHASSGRITLRCKMKDQDQKEEKEKGKEQTDGPTKQTDEPTKQQTLLVALHTYEASNPEDLPFNEGDTITLVSKVNEDWYEGQCHGNIGIFPASFVKEAPVSGQ